MTSKPRILLHNDDTQDLARKLRNKFPELEYVECNSYEALPNVVETFRPDIVYTVRFAGSDGFPRDALFGPQAPSWIANGGAGTDHFGHWDPEEITVTNAAGVAADMMAEYVFGGFLHFNLDIPGLQKDKSSKIWNSRKVRPLFGKTLLIIGLGHTGRAIAARAKAFGMHVVGTRSRPAPMENVDTVLPSDRLNDLLPLADYIAVSTPLTPQTTGILDTAEFDLMKKGVVLADVSRGKVINEAAMLKALEKGTISGAALDVFATEPLERDHYFWDIPNVIISPHCSSVYEGWEEASFDLFLSNLNCWLDGAPLINIVDPIRGY